MPLICFSYEADVPPRISHRDVAKPAPPAPRQMHTGSTCFSCGTDVSPRSGTRGAASLASSGQRQMHTGTTCFSY